MKHFYEQVHVDTSTFHFFAGCPLCDRKHFSGRLPWFCRSRKLSTHFINGKGGIRQIIYAKCNANAVQKLALAFNRCEICGLWVCDQCFDTTTETNVCRNCVDKQTKIT